MPDFCVDDWEAGAAGARVVTVGWDDLDPVTVYLMAVGGDLDAERWLAQHPDWPKTLTADLTPQKTSLVLNLKNFDESLHPRDDHGRFGSGGGSDTGRPALTAADVSSATPAEFHARFSAAIATSPYINHVTNHTAAEIASEHMIPLTTNGGQTGVLIHDHGDGRIEATGLYNQSQVPGAGTDLLRYAVANNGVNYVEAYGPRLPELYAKAGFVTTEAYPFDPSQAAPGWNYPAFDNPDYHIMTIPGRL